ncbi:serine hydrolase domain-containing protein [Aurantiacibacter poecillastricola]|uniref:serine hydrolase domain-containing protein n=1 Tax=Aurantiacibacter poecillastricola TaxID=3064385 RepID=UPI00273D8400|nr:serine hydrolase domain-containing protein [Aurantiacibacter sp. 219JJ12-13]MDP5262213.1 serine hydrolase domain-containing protein [Aurantiacibacter sp. 219JJ12-13]
MRRTMLALAALSVSAPAYAAVPDCPAYDGETVAGLPADFAPVAAFPGPPLEETRQEALAAALDRAQDATGAPAIGAAIMTSEGSWLSADGDKPFAWASVAKLVTATIVMQMVEEGRLTLDDSVASHIDGVPGGSDITLAMLLSHTSGLASANEIVREEQLPFPSSLTAELVLVEERGPLFCPGSGWRYSNTGYAILGAVIEAVDDADFAVSVRRRIAEPLGLASFRIVTDPADADFARFAPAAGEPEMHPARAGSAGGLVATPRDMARFMQGLLGGALLPTNRLRQMAATSYPMFDAGTFYGLGLMIYRLPGADGGTIDWIGHSGGMPGAKAILAYDLDGGTIVAAALTGNGSAEATANLLLRTASAE